MVQFQAPTISPISAAEEARFEELFHTVSRSAPTMMKLAPRILNRFTKMNSDERFWFKELVHKGMHGRLRVAYGQMAAMVHQVCAKLQCG